MGENDILAVGESELDSTIEEQSEADQNLDDGTIQENETDEQEKEKVETEETETEDEETETEETAQEEDTDINESTDLNKNGEPITRDPLKDTKSALTKAQQENAELRKQLAEAKKKAIGDFELMTDEEEAEWAEEVENGEGDPVAYARYLQEKIKYLDDIKGIEAEEKEAERQAEVQAVQAKQEQLVNDLFTLAENVGVEIKDNKQFSQFANSGEMLKVAEFLNDPENGFARNGNGLFTPKQMKIAWDIVNRETDMAKFKANVYQQAVNNIKQASKPGSQSNLSKVAGDGGRKSFAKKTQADIDSMGETEAAEYLKSIEENPDKED